ncbi:MAG: HEAT repeat domain-containing protein [Muribaculaceae bacterium]|nr:HEAT repeat domain-containing protein [Muribaculaceae bacterium]
MNTINIIAYYWDLVAGNVAYFVTYLFDQFREFSWVIKFAAISLTISCLLVLFCFINILYRAWRNRRLRKRAEKMEKRYGEAVEYILSEESPVNMSREAIMERLDVKDDGKQPLKNNKDKMAFCRMVYDKRIAENAVAGRRKNLHTMMAIFRLREFLEDIINKGALRFKAESLIMMRAFKYPVNQWIANTMMNSRRKSLRRLSMYASVMSNSNTDLQYFESDFFDENCCIYDEIQLGYVLQRRRNAKRQIPNLAHWAYIQKNPSTQCVFIRLMRQFDQKEYCNELEDLFQHDSDTELIQEISRTWGYLRYEGGEPLMNDMLLTQADETKVAIMHALARIGKNESIDAFIDVYKHSTSQHVRFEALRSLYNSNELGRLRFHELQLAANDEEEKSLFEFFNNPLTRDLIELSDNDLYSSADLGDNIYSLG